MAETLIVVAYDVTSPKQRRRIFNYLSGCLRHVQFSLFEGRVDSREREKLFNEAKDYLLPGDSLRLYVVPDGSVSQCRTAGEGLPPMATDHLIID